MNRGIAGSYASLAEYLPKYSLTDVLKNPALVSSLKNYHRWLFALLCWQISLKGTDRAPNDMMTWFDECVSDLMQIIPLLAQGFYKPCNLLNRSAIENFTRHLLLSRGQALDARTQPRELFARTAVSLSGEPAMKEQADSLEQLYTELCFYVHSAGGCYLTLSATLSEYPTLDVSKLTECVLRLRRSLQAMNALLVMQEPEVYRAMPYSSRSAVATSLSRKDKRRLV